MKTITHFFHKNEKWLTPFMLLGGFVLDNLTLRGSDLLIENILLSIYFLVLMSSILLLHMLQSKSQKSVRILELESVIFLVIQFVFGGVFSALTVFYIKSASLFASWPFLLVLFGGMIATEYFKKHFNQFLIQLAALYLLIFTYSIVLIPLLSRSINTVMFLVSGLCSLVFITLYLLIFSKALPQFFINQKPKIIAVVLGIYVLMNLFYILNVIPPIPLALRESGVYKSVVRNGSEYGFFNLESQFSITSLKKVYKIRPGESVYFFSSVYAPVKFEQSLIHEWQKKNKAGKWTTISNIRFPISGGRSDGYRGYSISSNVTPGEWRVLVKISSGQVLGGETFNIEYK